MTSRQTGTREQWLAARNELLAKEKELTRRSDQLAAERPRGLEFMMVYHGVLDRTPLGRNEGDAGQL
jgi:predicted dithiol-disulfide oxidoreductase (DUF899 family)